MNNKNIKEKLMSLNYLELKSIAKDIGLPNRSLSKSELVEYLIENIRLNKLEMVLDKPLLSWWRLNQHNIYGWISILGLIFSIFSIWVIPKFTTTSDQIKEKINDKIHPIAMDSIECIVELKNVYEKSEKNEIDRLINSYHSIILEYNKHIFEDSYIKRSKDYFYTGKLDSAKHYLKLYKDKYPENSYGAFILGNLYEFEYEIEKAVKEYEIAVSLDDTNLDYYLALGKAQETMGLYNQAISNFNKSLTIFNESYQNLDSIRAEIYYKISIINYRLRKLDISEEFSDSSLILFKNINNPKNDESYSKIYTLKGLIYNSKGEYDKAIEFYRMALMIEEKTTNPDKMANLYNNIGTVQFRLGEYNNALNSFSVALNLLLSNSEKNDPDIAGGYNNLAIVYDMLEDNQNAIDYYQKTLFTYNKIYPSDHHRYSLLYNNMGRKQLELGEVEEALNLFNKALIINRNYYGEDHVKLVSSYQNMGYAYSEKQEYDMAIEYYTKAIQISEKVFDTNHPKIASTYNNIGLAYLRTKQYEKSLSRFGKALQINIKTLSTNHPSIANTYYNLGLYFQELKEFPKAIENFNKALDIYTDTYGKDHEITLEVKNRLNELNL